MHKEHTVIRYRWHFTPILPLLLLLGLWLPSPTYSREVTLAWDASAGATGYRLHWGTAAGVYTSHLDVGNVTTWTGDLNDLVYITATAYGPEGTTESVFSNEIQLLPRPPPATHVLAAWTEVANMAFPTTGILDDFSPDDAHPMTGWTDFYNGVDALGGVGLNAADDLSVSGWTTTFTADTIEGYVTITTKTTTDNKMVGILFNNGVTGDRYDLYIQYVAGVEKAQVFKYINGVYDSTVADITTTINNGDSFGMSVIGTLIKVYRKPSGGSWGQIGTTYTATALSLNQLALEIDGTTLRADDFGGGTALSFIPLMDYFRRRRN
jgi:hypothetical protein